ncbi:MAG: hypothetical protein HY934_08300 [Candidatus Firestonebacteria bacterium]|nr:hypothetical protein [Candidatus Firestonebacteria bacterium]
MSKKTTEHSKENKNNNHGNDHEHRSLPKAENPLTKIKEKELELRGKYLEVKKQAELIVAEARKKAGEIRRASTDRAIKEAQEYYDQKVAQIRNETIKYGEEEVINVNKLAAKKIPQAKEFLLKNIIPE